MAAQAPGQSSRRGFLEHAATGGAVGLSALMAGCARTQQAGSGPRKRLRAAFSNGGLTTTWCKLGHDTAMLWGEMLDVEVVWVDGELNPQKQREKIDLIVDDDWDFCAFQALQSGALEEPCKTFASRGVPVIGMDTLIVEKEHLREAGVWVQIAADHKRIAQSSTQYLMDRIGGQGKVIHIGGAAAHSGARQRDEGFQEIVVNYDVEVLGGGVRWCDWKTEKARDSFEALLQQSDEPIAGAFFHNDDMALASIPALKGTPHEKMVITACDGQKDGLAGVRDGRLAATTVNPTCMIHMMSLVVGQFICRNREALEDVPEEIPLPNPLVSKEAGNIDAMFYLSDPKHCLV